MELANCSTRCSGYILPNKFPFDGKPIIMIIKQPEEFVMRKLRLIATGGTIACTPTDEGLKPGLNAGDLLSFLDIDRSNIDAVDLFNIDSSNIQPEEWCRIAKKVLKTSWDFDAVVITHGTDTMAYTASMLSFMLLDIPIPVVLTGAQFPIVYPDSDGRQNLTNAIAAARGMDPGVYICFGEDLIKGCRAVKTRTTSLNAFESINYPYVGKVENGVYEPLTRTRPLGAFAFSVDIDPRVALIKLIPGTSPAILDNLPQCGVKGVVVEAFGSGGVHNIRRDHNESLKRLMLQGIPVILTSQCLYEASSPDIYQVSRALRDAGVISAYDMTTEAAVTKLMWALGRTGDMDEIRALMHTSLCGEITV